MPFGATTKMDGCAAIYPALAAIFVAQIFDVHLGINDYLLIAFVSVVGSAATAGLTGATVMLTLTLCTLGLPLEGVGLLLAIDPILDMIRTATNVAGQVVVPVHRRRARGPSRRGGAQRSPAAARRGSGEHAAPLGRAGARRTLLSPEREDGAASARAAPSSRVPGAVRPGRRLSSGNPGPAVGVVETAGTSRPCPGGPRSIWPFILLIR